MPIHESDPWRLQYFEGIACPDDVHIPTDDALAVALYPQFRWVYDKLLIAKSQELRCGLQNDHPSAYPVFCKPVTNLKGMGVGTRILHDDQEAQKHLGPDNFWMPLLSGTHISTDFAVVNGQIKWYCHTRGIPGPAGTFDYWIIESRARPSLEKYCGAWIRQHLSSYTGMLNVETIGGRIIEVHLRFADQWPDLYGSGWVESMVRLYSEHTWNFSNGRNNDGFSVVLFGPHGISYEHPSATALERWACHAGVTSVQVTFFEDPRSGYQAMPPGGFRLAIVNCRRLSVGLGVRSAMSREFFSPLVREAAEPFQDPSASELRYPDQAGAQSCSGRDIAA